MKNSCSFSENAGEYALTVVRVVLGVIFFMHGSQKVLGWFGGGGLVETVKGFTGMGMPAVLAYLVCFTEFSGGLGLIVGLLSRLAAFGIMCVMIGAVVMVHWKNGFFLQNQGYEYNLALIGLSLGVILGGSGCCALDNLFCKKKEGIAA